MRVRREKRQRLLDSGAGAYPIVVPRTHTLREVRATYDDAGARARTPAPATVVAVAGRVIFLRNTGKLCFARLREGDGTELQVMLSLAEVGRGAARRTFKALVDIGDLVGVDAARWCISRRGELSVQAHRWRWRPRRCARCPTSTGRCPTRPGCGSATST